MKDKYKEIEEGIENNKKKIRTFIIRDGSIINL